MASAILAQAPFGLSGTCVPGLGPTQIGRASPVLAASGQARLAAGQSCSARPDRYASEATSRGDALAEKCPRSRR
eukprot:15468430-Heterocapsa_arctica.AAC.1